MVQSMYTKKRTQPDLLYYRKVPNNPTYHSPQTSQGPENMSYPTLHNSHNEPGQVSRRYQREVSYSTYPITVQVQSKYNIRDRSKTYPRTVHGRSSQSNVPIIVTPSQSRSSQSIPKRGPVTWSRSLWGTWS